MIWYVIILSNYVSLSYLVNASLRENMLLPFSGALKCPLRFILSSGGTKGPNLLILWSSSEGNVKVR